MREALVQQPKTAATWSLTSSFFDFSAKVGQSEARVIKEDGASDWPTFAEKSRKLLVNDKVATVFGCWTSASRKAVLPIFEKENGLLYYPTFYEGLEQSKNVIYTGQEATQQIIYGLDWGAKEKKAKTFFLVGSDYIWPRTSMKIARKHIESVA